MKYLLSIFFAIQFCTFTYAQNDKSFSATFDHVALSVKDVDAAAAFYDDILHLQEITNRTEQEGIRWFSLGDGKELHLISTVAGDITITKAVHFALKMNNFDAFIAHLTAKFIPYTGWADVQNEVTIRADGIKQVYINDPDGNWIEINSVTNE